MTFSTRVLSEQHGGRILVVDDDRLAREVTVRWLRAAGRPCLEAGSGAEALAALDEQPVDLLVLDIHLPDMSGLDLLQEVRRRRPEAAVVMLSGVGEARTAIEALTEGASGYLIKPAEREELLVQVERALERRRLLLERRAYTRRLEQTVRERTEAVRRAYEETIQRLVAASLYRDVETGEHVRRTGLMAEAVARAVGWPDSQADQIRLAAPMHDVGKIGVPDEILRKPGPLTPEEMEQMKQHTVIGARMLSGSAAPILQMAEQIALCHHEWWNGQGYPRGLAGDQIPQAARIVAVVDVYDALTHDRVYRPAMPEERALRILRDKRGTHFDPETLDAALDSLGELRRIRREHPDGAARGVDVLAPLREAADLLAAAGVPVG